MPMLQVQHYVLCQMIINLLYNWSFMLWLQHCITYCFHVDFQLKDAVIIPIPDNSLKTVNPIFNVIYTKVSCICSQMNVIIGIRDKKIYHPYNYDVCSNFVQLLQKCFIYNVRSLAGNQLETCSAYVYNLTLLHRQQLHIHCIAEVSQLNTSVIFQNQQGEFPSKIPFPLKFTSNQLFVMYTISNITSQILNSLPDLKSLSKHQNK